jgi:glycosyltransferase involved in cell wall biosynthesis
LKKILIIPSWYPNIENPNSGIFFLEQARLFRYDYEIKVLCGVQKRDISRFKKIFNTIIFLFSKSVIRRTKEKYFLDQPEVIGFEYECGINLLKKINYNISLNSYIKTFAYISTKWKPDIIHAYDTFLGGIVASYINSQYLIPYIISEHNYLKLIYPGFILKDLIKAIEQAARILLVSEYQLRNLIMHNIKCIPEIIGNYVDDMAFTMADNKNEKTVFNILFVGRNAAEKDFKTLVKTIAEFDKLSTVKDYCFTVIGNLSDQKQYFINQLCGLNFNINLKIIDFVERDQIIEFFHSSDAYLSTSISETFGVGICEAMMCGIPVVSTNNGGFDEMYIPGVNGIKTGIKDYKALADSLYKIKTKKLVFDPFKIRSSVINKFGEEAFKSRMLKIYNSIYE